MEAASSEENTPPSKTIITDATENLLSDTQAELCKFYQEGKCRFGVKCFNLHVGDIEQDHDKKNKKLTIETTTTTAGQEKENECKKPPLRTAGDVRKRIQWDSSLPSEHFTVGYLDRFDGVVEKPFSAFTWEHLADAELDDLAIPQHRIHYYKYRGHKVWDKNIRLDHVFGSAGNTKTICEVMSEVDEQLYSQELQFNSSEDDDIVVLSGSPSGTTTNAFVSAAKEKLDQTDESRATHFLCIRIKNDKLAEEVQRVQETVINGDPVLRSCVTPSEILHVTLAMIKCDSEGSIEAVSKLVSHLGEDILKFEEFNPNGNVIIAKHLTTFGSRVLYSKLEVPSLFWKVVNTLQEKLNRLEGVTITNHFEFVPHMTLLKINRQVAKERRSKYINSSLYSEHFYKEFGEISFDNIHFCIRNDYRGYDGFYLTCCKIEF